MMKILKYDQIIPDVDWSGVAAPIPRLEFDMVANTILKFSNGIGMDGIVPTNGTE